MKILHVPYIEPFLLKLYENGEQYVAHYVVLVLCYDMKYLVAGNQTR